MRITTAGRYAVRAMLDLAQHQSSEPVLRQDIAERQQISAEYIAQLFRPLAKDGLVRSVLGPGGGYMLGREAASIRIGDIIRAVEGPIAAVYCAVDGGREPCCREDTCVTRLLWVGLSKAISQYLDGVTLQDLCERAELQPSDRHPINAENLIDRLGEFSTDLQDCQSFLKIKFYFRVCAGAPTRHNKIIFRDELPARHQNRGGDAVKSYDRLAITKLDDFLFGRSPNPVTLKNGLVIGGGQVYPELNFTLPGMEINAESLVEVNAQYSEMIEGACTRAVELNAPGLVVEFELLPELTTQPEWGAEVVKILREKLDETAAKHAIKVALRVTPNDIREFERPPIMRRGGFVDAMFRSFELSAQAGADFLSVESTGGKEIHDEALLNGDLPAAVFALGVLGANDMAYLWDRIVSIGAQYGSLPAGDSACGFGNTAMVLAEQHFIPRVWAAVVRVMTVPRSLVAFERGAVGPNKDCAYEGVYLKAITGCPISLEGAEAAVAHLSPIGNIAKAVPDLWSNELVNNVKLLGGMAPTVSLEQIVYATRLMNTASSHGDAGRAHAARLVGRVGRRV